MPDETPRPFSVRIDAEPHEIAADPNTLRALKTHLRLHPDQYQPSHLFGEIGAYFGFPFVEDSSLTPGLVHIRAAQDKRKMRPGDQPLPTQGREDVQDALIQLIKQRRDLGIARYGRPLQTFNGRDAARDALEEALDLSAYLMQVALEMDTLRHTCDYLATRLAAASGTPVQTVLDDARTHTAAKHAAKENPS